VEEVKHEVPSAVVTLNTSAFSRKLRHRELTVDDGLRLLTDISSYASFYRRAALDIHDVFDENVASLLLSPQNHERRAAVDELREIFRTSPANFEHAADVIVRWCCLQFIGRHVSISQAALLLLIEQLGCAPESFFFAPIELYMIVPVVLWRIATQSDAFTGLLHDIRKRSRDSDFGSALLSSLPLQHSVVTALIFDELKKLSDLSGLSEPLRKLKASSQPFTRSRRPRALPGSGTQEPAVAEPDETATVKKAGARPRWVPYSPSSVSRIS
jgi:hypothetical protein